jgi:hypothetical protein
MWHCLLQSRAWHNYAPDMKKLDGISFFLILVMTVFFILFGTMMQLYFSVIAYVVMTAPNQLFFFQFVAVPKWSYYLFNLQNQGTQPLPTC